MASTNFPFEIKRAVEAEKFAKFYKGKTEADFQVVVGPKKYVLEKRYEKYAEDIYNMPVRPDDTFVVAYPRSGTTLTQELVWLIKNDMDFEKAKSILLTDRYSFLEQFTLHTESSLKMVAAESDEEKKQILLSAATPATEVLAKMPSPRFIKSHLPISLLPAKSLDTAKMVYVARDPRDVLVSFYLFQLNGCIIKYEADFKDFCNEFMSNCSLYSPFLEHVKEGWELRNHPNLLFLFYDDLIKDMDGNMRVVAQFFGKQYTDEQFAALAQHLHIDNFKQNASVNFAKERDAGLFTGDFIRKGKSNGWTEFLDKEMQANMKKWMEEGLRGSTLRFPTQ